MTRSVFLLAMAAFSLPVGAKTPMTALKIHITSQSGKPVDRAEVIVRFVKGHSLVKLGKSIRTTWDLRSNEDGYARIPPIPQGTILVQVIAKNYQTFGETFDVDEEEKTLEIKLNPPQAQYSAH
jgi:hypothetical protein